MMKGGLGGLMKQAQKMQEQMQKAQEELATLTVTGEAGGGLVRVEMTGKHECRRIHIDSTLLEGDDRDMLEDLIAAAINDANRKTETMVQERMAGMLPPGMTLPL